MITYVLAISHQRFQFWMRQQELKENVKYTYVPSPYYLRGLHKDRSEIVILASFNEKVMTFGRAMEWYEMIKQAEFSKIKITRVPEV